MSAPVKLRAHCPVCNVLVDVTGKGTIARHTTRDRYFSSRRNCEGNARPAGAAVDAWATEHCAQLRAIIDGHDAYVEKLRLEYEARVERAAVQRDDAAIELAAIDALMTKRAKAAAKGSP